MIFEQWDSSIESLRFVQFAFERDCFHMDIPSQTLSCAEAQRVLALQRGFFYLSDGPEFTLFEEDIEDADPFRGVYFYGDERRAAEDMAAILYSIWGLIPEFPIFVTASPFGEGPDWEQDVQLPLDEFEPTTQRPLQ